MNKQLHQFNTEKGIGKCNYYVLYTIIFCVSVLFVFGCFFYHGKSFIWNTDGFQQHLRALIYYGSYMRSVVKELMAAHIPQLPTFSFSLGYGSDILNVLHYYVIGDPLALLAVFVPTKGMVYFYNVMIILRFYLAGIAFSVFCFYINGKTETKVNYGKMAILAGTFVYVFCGFALFGGIRHPYFLNPMIYFPFVLLGVEKILNGEKPYLFVVAVFISAISNFYFFYMIAILTGMYTLLRLASTHPCRQYKEISFQLAKIAVFAVLGTCMAAIIMLPEVKAILSSSRTGDGYVYSLLYTIQDYATYPRAFLSVSGIPVYWTYIGYASIVLIACFLLFMQKGYRSVKLAFIVLTAMTLIPACGYVMSGFSYVSNRWIWGYGFLVAYIVVLKWEALFSLTKKEKLILILGLVSYLVLCVVLKESRKVPAMFAMLIAFLSIAIILMTNRLYGIRCSQVLLFICILINITCNAFFRYSYSHGGYVKEFFKYKEARYKLENTEANVIKPITEGASGFFRYSGTSTVPNGALQSGLHSTDFYWSLGDGVISKFRKDAGLSDQITPQNYKGLDSRTILSTLANVKYYVQPANVPYGFSPVKPSNELSKYRLWKNNYYLPFGYTYSGYITEEDYEAMTPMEKQEAILQGCVVGEPKGNRAEVTFSGKQVEYKLKPDRNIVIKDNVITVKKRNASVKLLFDGVSDAETYLYITGLNYIGNPAAVEQSEWLSEYRKDRSLFYEKYYEGPDRLKLPLSAKDTDDQDVSKNLVYCTPKYPWYSGREDFMVNFGFSKKPKSSISIRFPVAGKYAFNSIQVLCQPMDGYPEHVKLLAEDVLQDVDLHENKVFATDTVTEKIVLDKAKYLLLTIPYSAGWTAYVDGVKHNIIKANTMFMALYLEPGKHDITLKYHTPGLRVGAIISTFSIMVFVGMIMVGRRREFFFQKTQK